MIVRNLLADSPTGNGHHGRIHVLVSVEYYSSSRNCGGIVLDLLYEKNKL